MRKMVVILHTSFVFFQREPLLFELLDELLPDVERANIVEDKLLHDVMTNGQITSDVMRRMCHYVMAAEAIGADVIFNSCSSLGPTMDVARQITSIPIVKIDEGMARLAAQEGERIGVLATVPTTLQPTICLIEDHARG